MEGLFYHQRDGMQTNAHTGPALTQRNVFTDDSRILMKKHTQRDVAKGGTVRAVAIVNPSLCVHRD